MPNHDGDNDSDNNDIDDDDDDDEEEEEEEEKEDSYNDNNSNYWGWVTHVATSIWVNIGLVHGLLPDDTTPLSELMLTSRQ